MKRPFTALSALMGFFALFGAPVPPAAAETAFESFAGDYVVVAVRQNSFTASPAGIRPGGGESPIGQRIGFNASGVVLDGIACDDWQAESIPVPVDFADDTQLADLRLGPTTSPLSDGDKRLSKAFRITCEGEAFTTLYQADSRVLAMSWANSSKYLILERPLDTAQLARLQKALKSMKFYSGPVTGEPGEDTDRAVRSWFSYRLANPDAAIPRRPARTENLLDTLKVLN